MPPWRQQQGKVHKVYGSYFVRIIQKLKAYRVENSFICWRQLPKMGCELMPGGLPQPHRSRYDLAISLPKNKAWESPDLRRSEYTNSRPPLGTRKTTIPSSHDSYTYILYYAYGHEFKSRLKWKCSNFPHHPCYVIIEVWLSVSEHTIIGGPL